MTTATAIDLRALIRDELREGEMDFDAVAERVSKLVPEEELRDALAQALRRIVEDVVRYQRTAARNKLAGGRTKWDTMKDGGAIAEAVRRLLVQREPAVGKTIGDLDYDDLTVAIEVRTKNGLSNLRRAEQYEHLRSLLPQDGTTVSALDPSKVMEAFA